MILFLCNRYKREGLEKGLGDADREWEQWFERNKEAIAAGKEPSEPMPSQARNGAAGVHEAA